MKRLKVEFKNASINMSLPQAGVLTAMVTVADRSNRDPDAEDEVLLELRGLDATDEKHPDWGTFDLVPGDTVVISVHDDRLSDRPNERREFSREDDEQRQRDYVREKAAEFGWVITQP
jgi:hypothetical protein